MNCYENIGVIPKPHNSLLVHPRFGQEMPEDLSLASGEFQRSGSTGSSSARCTDSEDMHETYDLNEVQDLSIKHLDE